MEVTQLRDQAEELEKRVNRACLFHQDLQNLRFEEQGPD